MYEVKTLGNLKMFNFFAPIVSHGHTAVAREARIFQFLNIGGLKFSSQKQPQGGLL